MALQVNWKNDEDFPDNTKKDDTAKTLLLLVPSRGLSFFSGESVGLLSCRSALLQIGTDKVLRLRSAQPQAYIQTGRPQLESIWGCLKEEAVAARTLSLARVDVLGGTVAGSPELHRGIDSSLRGISLSRSTHCPLSPPPPPNRAS